MTRDFAGYDDLARIDGMNAVDIQGERPDPSALPLLMTSDRRVRFSFAVKPGFAGPARLRLHTADQANAPAPQLKVTVNGRRFEASLPGGLGIQNSDPAHLAFPCTAEFTLSGGTLVEGENSLEIRVQNDSWFTWDAIDLIKCAD